MDMKHFCYKEVILNKTLILPSIYCVLVVTSLISVTQAYLSGYYTDNGYQTYLNRKLPDADLREQEKIISKEMMNLLGLSHKPKVRPGTKRKKAAPQFMMELYNQIQNDDEDMWDSAHNLNKIHYNVSAPDMKRQVGDADVIMSFEDIANHFYKDHQHVMFDFSEVPATEAVSKAELRMYKNATSDSDQIYAVNIYQVRNENSNTSMEKLTSFPLNAQFHGWFHVDVTDVVQEWLDFPLKNSGLKYTVTDTQGTEVPPSLAGLIDETGPDDLQTFLVSFFRAPQLVHVRQRRSVDKRKKKERSLSNEIDQNANYYSYNKAIHCHKDALYIQFSELGWQEWIIAPEGYAAFHCTGKCIFPLTANMNATNHAIVQTLVSLMEPRKVPQPCCAPTKMTAISVLYFDDKSNVILKKYKNMVVKSCGCQ